MLGALEVASLPLASPVPEPTAPVERVLGSFASKHRPAVPPPIVLAPADVQVPRESSVPTVDTLGLLHTLGLHFTAFVIDDDEMQTRCFEEARELANPRI